MFCWNLFKLCLYAEAILSTEIRMCLWTRIFSNTMLELPNFSFLMSEKICQVRYCEKKKFIKFCLKIFFLFLNILNLFLAISYGFQTFEYLKNFFIQTFSSKYWKKIYFHGFDKIRLPANFQSFVSFYSWYLHTYVYLSLNMVDYGMAKLWKFPSEYNIVSRILWTKR